MMAALHQIGLLPRHVVTQIIEAELVVGAVGDVGIVLLATLRRLLIGDDAADAHAQETVDAPHDLALVAGQIVVHGDHMHALALQGVQIARQGGDQGLAFARLHFGDVPPVQGRAAHELHIEMALPENALGSLAHRCECLRHEFIQALAILQLLLELSGLPLEFFVRKRRDLIFKSVHGLGDTLKLPDLTAFAHAQCLIDNIYHVLLLCRSRYSMPVRHSLP